jgi:hypothetical protein
MRSDKPETVWIVRVGDSEPDVWDTREAALAAGRQYAEDMASDMEFDIEDGWSDEVVIDQWNSRESSDWKIHVTEHRVMTRT